MELRHLRYFVCTAEELNFTRAAARLHIAQPALTVQIQKLEAEIGAELFSRESRNIKLTEAGRVFLDQARQTLMNADRSVLMARRAAGGEIGRLSIGYNTPAEFRLFPKIIPAFKRRWPDVHLSFQSLRTPHQLEGLRRNELDLGFVWLPVPPDGLDVQELTREPFVAVLPADHRLASAPTVSIRDLSQEPLILFPRARDPESFYEIEQLFLRAGAVINVVHELDVLLSVINFVAMGTGCSVLPDYVRRIGVEGIVYKPLRRPNIVKSLAIIKKTQASALADKFYRFTIEHLKAKELSGRGTPVTGKPGSPADSAARQVRLHRN